MIYTTDQIREIVTPIAASYGIKSLALFGSYARHEATEDSDIDLLVDRDGMAGGWAIGGLYTDLAEALKKELDMVTVTCADFGFLQRIRNEAIMLYEREEKKAV